MQRSEALPASEVIRLLRDKVARNPGDLDSFLMLGSALYQSGDLTGSISAFQSLLKLSPGHFQALLLLARSEARSGNTVAALKVLSRAQQADPNSPEAWQLATALAADIRDWAELLRISNDWVRAQPNSTEAWQTLSRSHFEESRFREAIAAFKRVLELEPGNASHLVGAARLAIAAQQYDQARDYLNTAKKIEPELTELQYTMGRLHHMTGELDSAEDCYRKAIAARPGHATAYVELGTLRDGRLNDAEIRAVNRLFSDSAVHPEYRVMLGFTLGDALDRRGEFVQAFAAWDKANEINRRISEQEGFIYQPRLVESEPELLAGIFAEPFELNISNNASDHPRPIFVVGMPRSGTTLVESILASHSQVYGAGELPTLYDIHEELMQVARDRGVEKASEMVRDKAAGWRERYLSALPVIENKTRVVDKQPLNYRSIGLIRLLFPDSPVVYTHRPPMDVGLSIYRHKFSKSWPCAHNLSDIGHYYGVHVHIINYWRERYPEATYWLDHSRLVKEPQAEIGRLLEFANLSSEPACFNPHKTKRPIATFSSVQVRQPVSAAFAGRARHYTSQLAPLRQALITAGIEVDNEGFKERDAHSE